MLDKTIQMELVGSKLKKNIFGKREIASIS